MSSSTVMIPKVDPLLQTAEAVLRGEIRAAARLMRDLDDRIPYARDVLRRLWSRTGRAHVIGITGNPGAGKSTVVDGLIAHLRKAGERVGVVLVDPTSPFSHGAILGDRIRMQRHATDDGVFIRSLATRGHLGGLSRSTAEVVAVLDAMGYERILIETVGVGQAEVDVVKEADTTVVVTVPGLGDEVQAIKAGILEIADVLVVNKADREGADRSVRDLMTMLELRRGTKLARERADIEIVRTVATRGEGIPELYAAIETHRLSNQGAQRQRRLMRAASEVRDAVLEEVNGLLESTMGVRQGLIVEVAERKLDPYTAAAQIFEESLRTKMV